MSVLSIIVIYFIQNIDFLLWNPVKTDNCPAKNEQKAEWCVLHGIELAFKRQVVRSSTSSIAVCLLSSSFGLTFSPSSLSLGSVFSPRIAKWVNSRGLRIFREAWKGEKNSCLGGEKPVVLSPKNLREDGVYLLCDLPLRLSHGCDLFVLGVSDDEKHFSSPVN